MSNLSITTCKPAAVIIYLTYVIFYLQQCYQLCTMLLWKNIINKPS
jgi:hypothetical protein